MDHFTQTSEKKHFANHQHDSVNNFIQKKFYLSKKKKLNQGLYILNTSKVEVTIYLEINKIILFKLLCFKAFHYFEMTLLYKLSCLFDLRILPYFTSLSL